MVNIIIPAAGNGSRFQEQGYEKPKPLIDVGGKPMIERVLEQFNFPGTQILVIIQQKHYIENAEEFEDLKKRYNLEYLIIGHLTEGTACTVLEGLRVLEQVDLQKPCIVANSDQVVDTSLEAFYRDSLEKGSDGATMVFQAVESKWSFCRVVSGKVEEVREKQVISNVANVGIYYYRSGHLLQNSIETMIQCNSRVNGEFYLAPTYNYIIESGGKVTPYYIDRSQMHGLGTPEDLTEYLEWKLQN